MKLRVALATPGKFHFLDLAREIYQQNCLVALFTGYPALKLKDNGVPRHLIRSFPWLQGLYMQRAKLGLTSARFERELAWWALQSVDSYAAALLPKCDIFMSMTGCGLKAGKKAQRSGSIYISDRGSSHIRYQDNILREEYGLHHLPYAGIDPRVLDKEEAEYKCADAVTVPSTFAWQSFREMGIAATKLHQIPYGVRLDRFFPTTAPATDRFEALFVGSVCLRKGIPYLLEAFAQLRHPNKQLTLVGTVQEEIKPFLARYQNLDCLCCTGPLPQHELKHLMSRSHVMVLPSIEDGFGLVMAQAMACGCPVIATVNTGAPDLYQDGKEGFIVPIRNPIAITLCLEKLANDSGLRERMAKAALQRVNALDGWGNYGRAMMQLFIKMTGDAPEHRGQIPC
jgi:starch synthase